MATTRTPVQSLWMLGAALAFTGCAISVKLSTASCPAWEVVFWRSLLGAIAGFFMMVSSRTSFGTKCFGTHMVRDVVGCLGCFLSMYSVSALPIGTAQTLAYTSPLMLAAILTGLAVFHREPPQWRLIASIAVGFAGIVMILQPSIGPGQELGAAAALSSAGTSAATALAIARLGRLGEPGVRTVFYSSVVCTLISLVIVLLDGGFQISWAAAPAVAGVGIFSLIGQLCQTRAWGHGTVLVTATLQFSTIVFSVIAGILLFGDRLGLLEAGGIALIIAAGLVATIARLTPRKAK